MNKSIIAALQLGASPLGKADTLSRILSYEEEIMSRGAKLVVMPEALLGGYPKGQIFGTYLGYRLAEGREAFAQYYQNAIDIDGEECQALAGLSARTGADLVVGAIERDGNTLYCSALFFSPQHGLQGKHRKLMPTGTERLIWGMGDGSTLPVVETQAGKVAAVICWENQMPLLRMAMYGKGVQIWCAPTVDEREIWQCTMRHIAHEGRCFVVSACQVQPSPAQLGIEVAGWDDDRPLINGGSVIIDPLGQVLAGPLTGSEGLLCAEIDLDFLVKARYDLDITGHYARPDIFSLTVDGTPRPGITYLK